MNNTLSPLGMDCRTWNGVEIQRRPSDGYVNATAMCQAGGKRFNDYVRVERTREYLRALAAQTGGGAAVAGIPATGKQDLIQTIQGGPPQLQGTWIHPRLAVDLARWISPEFAVWMDGWFLDVMRQKLAGGGGLVPASGLPAGICWQGLAELYAADREDELRGLPEIDRPRSAKFSRYVAEHFIQWLLMRHGQVSLRVATDEAVTVGFSPQQPIHQAPAAPVEAAPRRQFNRSTLQRSDRRGQQPFEPGYRIAAPELARLLGISPSSLNDWARRSYIGAIRCQADGTAWMLVGKGKISCGPLGSTVPPGGPSWLFQRLEDHGRNGTLFSHSEV